MSEIITKLQGGDLRSIGNVQEVVLDILQDNTLFAEVIEAMTHENAIIKMRASDAIEKVSRVYPQFLQPFKNQLLNVISKIEQQEVRWHVAQMLPRLTLEHNEISQVINLLIDWLDNSKSKIVRVNSLQALAEIADKYDEHRPFVVRKIKEVMMRGSPSVKSRGKKLIKKLVVKTGGDEMNVLIRHALVSDNEVLTNISFASKRYWGYPDEYFDIWKDELTITPSYIRNNIVFVAEENGRAIGYFSLVEVKNDFWAGKVLVNAGYWLEHIFILPEHIGKGIGTQLMNHLRSKCEEMSIYKIRIFSDPNARGFYDKVGARYIGEAQSSVEGRTVSLYELNFK